MPLISVVIPTYNCSRYLAAAVDSVLGQTFKDFEVLVIDDGSTDDTEVLMRRYGTSVRYLRQQNSGVSLARNRGIEQSRGRYVGFLDADDTWDSHKLERQMAALADHGEYRVCHTAFEVVDSALNPIRLTRSNRNGSAIEDLLTRGNVVGSICTVLCERALFAEAGTFDPALSQCADWDMWVRLATLTDFLYLDEPLVTYRQHESNMSRNAPLLERDSLLVLEKGYALPGLPSRLRARRRAAFARNYMVLAGTYLHAGKYFDFLRCAGRAVTLDFHQFGYLMSFPLRVVTRLRSSEETS